MLFTLLNFSTPATARVLNDLNQVSLPVQDRSIAQRKHAFEQGFEMVVSRFSGATPARVKTALRSGNYKAQDYLQRYYYTQNNLLPENSGVTITSEKASSLILVMIFDPVALGKLMNALDLPLWGTNRPQVLTWIVIGDQLQRYILGSDHQQALTNLLTKHFRYSDDIDIPVSTEPNASTTDGKPALDPLYLKFVGSQENLVQHLDDLAKQRGLPMLFPLMDLEDSFALDSADLWGRFIDPIRTASDRYNPDVILVGRLQISEHGWLNDWLLIDKGGTESWQSSSELLIDGLDEGLSTAIEQLSSRFAVQLNNAQSNALVMSISNIKQIEDLADLQDYLENLTATSKVELVSVNGDTVMFKISLAGSLEALRQSIDLSKKLVEATGSMPQAGFQQTYIPSIFYQWHNR